MNFLERLKSALKKAFTEWQKLPTARKLLVATVIIASLVLIVLLGVEAARPNYVVLVKNLSEEEAGRIAQALENMSIPYK
ncbi:MAG: flagellar M-ring protein FliF, partial [Thermotogae bacterium]